MPQDVSADMIEAIYAEDQPPMALLITLDSPTLAEPILATSDPEGTTSRGQDFRHFPFGFSFGGSGQDEAARDARLEIANSDARIMQAVRSLPAGAQVAATAELVMVDSPDDVEMALLGARVSSIESDDPKVTATISTRDFDSEPACQARFIKSRTPGLL